MPSDREKLESEDLGALADRMAQSDQNSRAYDVAYSELMRRQTEAQLKASKAQSEAAEATKETAKYTRLNAKYMLWSVIALAVSSFVTAALTAVGMWLKARK